MVGRFSPDSVWRQGMGRAGQRQARFRRMARSSTERRRSVGMRTCGTGTHPFIMIRHDYRPAGPAGQLRRWQWCAYPRSLTGARSQRRRGITPTRSLPAGGASGPPYNVLLHSPDIAARTAHLAGYSIFESPMPLDVKEIAISTAARGLNCDFAFASHIGLARDAGVSADTIEAIVSGGSTEGLRRDERQIVGLRSTHSRAPRTGYPTHCSRNWRAASAYRPWSS